MNRYNVIRLLQFFMLFGYHNVQILTVSIPLPIVTAEGLELADHLLPVLVVVVAVVAHFL